MSIETYKWTAAILDMPLELYSQIRARTYDYHN